MWEYAFRAHRVIWGSLGTYVALSAGCLAASTVLFRFPPPTGPDPYVLTVLVPCVFTVLGPPAWLLWGLDAFPLFVLGSMPVIATCVATLLLWSRFDSRPVFAAGLTIAALFWLAAGWFAWFVTF